MDKQYLKGRGYNNANTTKEALTGQPEVKQLSCAAERGIYRATKHDNRKRKRIQHEQNVRDRAVQHQGSFKKGK